MEQKREELLKKVSALFMRFGFKSLTMDDVARELGVSKKTLYQFFEDKNDLIKQSVIHYLKRNQELFSSKFKEAKNAVEQIFMIMQCVSDELKDSHPSIMYDLKKYYPESYDLLNQHKFSFVQKLIRENIQRGKNEGFYKSNFNDDIISKLYVSRVDVLFDTEIFPREQYTFTDVYIEFIKYHLYALATPKGIKKIEKFFNQLTKYESKK
jgi:AcrR family transcriptional regulator